MSFQEALTDILSNSTLLTSYLHTEEEITINNFKVDCANYGILIDKVQFGGYKTESVANSIEEPFSIEQIIERAYTIIYMTKDIAYEFINHINIEGNVIAEKIKYVRDDMYDTIYPSLIPNIPTSYSRNHVSDIVINTIPFEIQSIYNLVVNKSNYEYFLSQYSIVNYDNLEMIMVLDPKSGRKANAYPGLFSEIGKAIRIIESINTHSEHS
jgi:hypothetical protein